MSTLFIAGLDTETNSFSPIPTDEAAFRAVGLAFGDSTRHPLNTCSAQLALWRDHAEALGMRVDEGPCAVAEPGGPIPRAFYEALRDRLLEDLTRARPGMVLLALHGAAIAEGYDDVEGDILARARSVVGPEVFIGATLDPHAHLTPAMLANASALIAYKEYPHSDVQACARALMDLALATRAGRARPVMAQWDCRMIGAFPTQTQPMRGFVDSLIAAERADPSILSLSLIHGFAHGDVPDAGARMLAVTDGDSARAATLAREHGQRFVALREAVMPRFIGLEQAMMAMEQAPLGNKPLVLADTGDNPGGGAPGDATFLLRACLERGLTGIAFAMIHDPAAVAACMTAGVGARFDLDIGGRHGSMSGAPMALRGARVAAIGHNIRQRFGDVLLPMGNAARLDVDGLTIIVNDHRTQVFDPVCLTSLGVQPASYRALVVKSLNHFAALFAPLAGGVLCVATPGVTSPAYIAIPYCKRSLAYWPRQADPW